MERAGVEEVGGFCGIDVSNPACRCEDYDRKANCDLREPVTYVGQI